MEGYNLVFVSFPFPSIVTWNSEVAPLGRSPVRGTSTPLPPYGADVLSFCLKPAMDISLPSASEETLLTNIDPFEVSS